MGKKIFAHDNIGFIELLDVFGDDLTVVNAARVSFNKESQVISDRDTGLINYLAKHQHITPFFHPMVRLRIKMPIFVMREWYRHSVGFARNEVSRRYVTDQPECFIPSRLRMRDANVKQGSKEESIEHSELYIEQMRDFCTKACEYYTFLLESNVCPEQARMVLPQCMYSEFIETASLAGYARLVKLRLEASAQREIQVYAGFVHTLLQEKFPVSWQALMQFQSIEEMSDEHQTGHLDSNHGQTTQHDRTIL